MAGKKVLSSTGWVGFWEIQKYRILCVRQYLKEGRYEVWCKVDNLMATKFRAAIREQTMPSKKKKLRAHTLTVDNFKYPKI